MDYNNDDKSISNVSVLIPDTGTLTIQGNGAIKVPEGTSAQRPVYDNGYLRVNSETGYVEISSGSNWVDIVNNGLPTGGSAGQILVKNSSTDYDASFGPITADMAPYARQLVAYVKNDTQTTIPKGTPVYQTGNAGSSWTVLVRPADAADVTKMPAIGALAQDLAPSATGELIILGEIRDVDTSAFNAGDLVYVAPGGGYTNIKPSDPNIAIQFLGIVTKVHQTNGGGYVTGTGTLDTFRLGSLAEFEGWDGLQWKAITGSLDTLTDVVVTNPVNGQTLSFDGTNWINVSGGAASTSHAILSDRSLADQHPIGAITGLQTALDNKSDITHAHTFTDLTAHPTTLSGYGITDAVNKTGDTMTGSLSLPKAQSDGLLIDGAYSWMDIIGDVTPKTGGAQSATLRSFIGNVTAWTHTASSYGELLYHIPHEYAPNTDMHIHIHWGHNGTNITGSFIVNFWASYAKRSYPATPFITPVPLTLTLNNLDMTNSPRYGHRVDEILLSTVNGSANLLDTSILEVDGLIALHYEINTIPSITGSSVSNLPYIFTIDLHIQSKNIGTINKDPNYYGVI